MSMNQNVNFFHRHPSRIFLEHWFSVYFVLVLCSEYAWQDTHSLLSNSRYLSDYFADDLPLIFQDPDVSFSFSSQSIKRNSFLLPSFEILPLLKSHRAVENDSCAEWFVCLLCLFVLFVQCFFLECFLENDVFFTVFKLKLCSHSLLEYSLSW